MPTPSYTLYIRTLDKTLGRARRPGRPDGGSLPGNFVVRWQDEDAGWRVMGVYAESETAALAAVAHLVNSNTARAYRV